MRRGILVFVALGAGCADKPEALSLESREAALGERAGAVLAWAPHRDEPDEDPDATGDAHDEPLDPEPEPEPEVASAEPEPAEPRVLGGVARPRLRLSYPERRAKNYREPEDLNDIWVSFERCTFMVQAYGFPAISEDGGTIVDLFPDRFWESDGGEGIEWMDAGDPEPYREIGGAMRDLATGEVTTLSLSTTEDIAHHGQYVACRKAAAQLEQAIDEVNATLRAKRWRRMHDAETLGIAVAWDPEEAAELRGLPRDERGLEFLAQQRALVLRDPGVKVLHRQPTDWEPEDPNCFSYPQVSNLFIDVVSGAGIVQLTASCTCFGSEGVVTEVLQLSEDAVARVKSHAAV